MRKIALETVVFKKMYRYLRIDFSMILKRALFLLFIENLIYLIFQIFALHILSFNTTINNTSPVFPIISTIIYISIVILIYIFQIKVFYKFLILLKVLEFIFFTILLGNDLISIILSFFKCIKIRFYFNFS